MHVLEPPDLWQRYIDPAWKHAAPVGLTELRRDMRVKVKSSVVLRIGTVRPQRGPCEGNQRVRRDVVGDAEPLARRLVERALQVLALGERHRVHERVERARLAAE